MIKAVIFDYGGVVKTGHPLFMDIPQITGLSEEEIEKTKEERMRIGHLAEKGIISDKQYWLDFSRLAGKNFPDNCVELAEKSFREAFELHSDIIKLAKDLKRQNIKTAVLSNIFKYSADVIRENKGYDEFDPVVLSYEVGTRKPEPEIYLLAIQKLGVQSEECIFVDDREVMLSPAEKLGIKTVLFKNSKQAIKDILLTIKKNKKNGSKI